MLCLNDLENPFNKLSKISLLTGILYVQQQNVSDVLDIIQMSISSKKWYKKMTISSHQLSRRTSRAKYRSPENTAILPQISTGLESGLYKIYFTLSTARELYLYSVRQHCEYSSVPQFAWNHQPKLTNKTVKESEHVSSCLLFPFELYLVHSLQSNQLIKHCNLNCRKMYGENLYTGCLLSERAIHEMSLAEPISV